RGGGSGRDGGDPAGRLGEGFGSDCGGGRARDGDGIHGRAAFPALKKFSRKGAKPAKFFYSAEQPVNQNELAERDGGNQRPEKKFADAQAALLRGGEQE